MAGLGPDVPELAALLAGTAKLPFFRVLMLPTERFAAENGPEILQRHLLWLRDAERDGGLFLCGPIGFGEGWDGTGMGVLRAEGVEQARAIAAGEPYHQAGLRRNEVDAWLVNEGSLTVTVSLMDHGRGRLS